MSPLSETSPAKPAEAQSKVLFIRAGITRLMLGQGLKRHGITFSILERTHQSQQEVEDGVSQSMRPLIR